MIVKTFYLLYLLILAATIGGILDYFFMRILLWFFQYKTTIRWTVAIMGTLFALVYSILVTFWILSEMNS